MYGLKHKGSVPIGPFLLLLFVHFEPLVESFSQFFSQKLNPCTFPTPKENNFAAKCQITNPHVKRYNICDPETAISMSEVLEIVHELDKTYLEKDKQYGQSCVCDSHPSHTNCWYKFGFAYIREMPLPLYELPEVSLEICTNTSKPNLRPFLKTKESVEKFGQQYADLLRLRWDQGYCGEDILFLIVKKRPTVMSLEGAEANFGRKPVIFVSMGSTVKKRSRHLYIPHLKTKTLTHIVQNINDKFQSNGLTLKPAYEHLIEEYVKMLTLADQTYYSPKQRNHIPNWALAAFGGCVLLLIVMAVGLFLAKSQVRRGVTRAKPSGEQNRKWKAGFVGGMFMRKKSSKKEGADGNFYEINA